jgi:hypothetical protein
MFFSQLTDMTQIMFLLVQLIKDDLDKLDKASGPPDDQDDGAR